AGPAAGGEPGSGPGGVAGGPGGPGATAGDEPGSRPGGLPSGEPGGPGSKPGGMAGAAGATALGGAKLGHIGCGDIGSWPMQITVQDGGRVVGCCHGHIGCWLAIPDQLRSISGVWASGSVDGKPWMLSGRPGPSPSGCSRCSRCRSAIGGGG